MSVVSHGGCEPSFPVRATLGGLAGLWAVGCGRGPGVGLQQERLVPVGDRHPGGPVSFGGDGTGLWLWGGDLQAVEGVEGSWQSHWHLAAWGSERRGWRMLGDDRVRVDGPGAQ